MPRFPSFKKKAKATASSILQTTPVVPPPSKSASLQKIVTTTDKSASSKILHHPSSTASSLSSSSSSSLDANHNQPAAAAPPSRGYYRGGGYCNHVHRSYEERWSDDHVELVLKSWNMTERQREKLMEFKQRVQHVDHPLLNCPQQLVYFLFDEAGNIDAAEKWFHSAVKLRRERPHDMDTLCETFTLPDDFDYMPLAVLDGYDRDGDPIHITRTGAGDIFGLYQRHGRETLTRHALYYQELAVRGVWIEDYERRRGKKVRNYTWIFDLQGLSMRHVKPQLLPVLAYVSRLVQDTYPGLVKRVLIVHAPYVFKMIWGMVKHFFDPELRAFFIFASGDADSHKLLEQYIDPNVLPTCIHPAGKDGRVARGYEHVVVEGGPLPPEGTYRTPDYCKLGLTRAEFEAGVEPRYRNIHKDDLLGESTRQISNTRKDSSFRNKNNTSSIFCQCQTLLCGNFYDEDSTAGEFHPRIEITSSNQHLVGLN